MTTDQQLQLELARLLPDKIEIITRDLFFWKFEMDFLRRSIKETEWLHICWLIEKTIPEDEYIVYLERLTNMCEFINPHRRDRFATSASWQQRATAILATKGIKVCMSERYSCCCNPKEPVKRDRLMFCTTCGHGQTFAAEFIRHGTAVGKCDVCHKQRNWRTGK